MTLRAISGRPYTHATAAAGAGAGAALGVAAQVANESKI